MVRTEENVVGTPGSESFVGSGRYPVPWILERIMVGVPLFYVERRPVCVPSASRLQVRVPTPVQ